MDLGEEHQRAGGDRESGNHEPARANPRQQPGRDAHGADHHAHDHGKERESGLDGREALDPLQVVREEQEHAEHADLDERHRGERADAVALAQQVQREQRVRGAALDEHKHGEQNGADCESREHETGGPAALLGLAEAVDDGHEPTGREHGSGHVEPGANAAAAVIAEEHGRSDHGDDGDRHVHHERPAPVDELRKQATEDQTDGRAAACDRAVDAESAGALLGLREGDVEHGEGGRSEECGEGALKRARRHEHLEALCEASQRGRGGEAGEADDQRALATENVAEPPAEQEQSAEGEGVRGDDPLAVGIGDAEILLHGRHRDVDDGHVENDHELREPDGRETPPAAGIGGGVHVVPFTGAPQGSPRTRGGTDAGDECEGRGDSRRCRSVGPLSPS